MYHASSFLRIRAKRLRSGRKVVRVLICALLAGSYACYRPQPIVLVARSNSLEERAVVRAGAAASATAMSHAALSAQRAALVAELSEALLRCRPVPPHLPFSNSNDHRPATGPSNNSATRNRHASTIAGEPAPDRRSRGCIDINEASARRLERLPRIGPTIAERIIAERPFAAVSELRRVRGIGAATLQGLLDRVCTIE